MQPDVTAPGVDILAATSNSLEKKENPFVLKSGTSMSSPHVSGIAALIKKIHPDWSTAAIQSSLMTTGMICNTLYVHSICYKGRI